MNFVYVAVGIACLIALQLLRGALSIVFPRYAVRPVRAPDAERFGGLDLVDAKTEAFSALGFAGPAWVGDDDDTDGIPAHAVYRNEAQHTVAWIGPTIELAQPNQLLTYYTTLLEDGRYAVTQISDPYFEVIGDPMTPAQTIAPSDEASELAAHLEFVRQLGAAPANATPRDDVLQFAGPHMTAIRDRLLERKLIRETDGVARPTLRFALSLIRAMFSRPKSDNLSQAVPTSRLPYLAASVERTKQRAPAQGTQWLLMVVSGVLFVGIGWPLLGLDITLVLLIVIALHEAGHWLAMRLFGYGNPHITLLPLLGGVTIGHENDPNAAKRAWVALAGPLPGIALGWALIVWGVSYGDLPLGQLGFVAVTVLLFVNYLNILPIPPLDGHHVVQAILPPRWVVLQILLILVGVAAGVYVAYLVEFWPLAVIAGLQLLGLPSLWRTTRIVRELTGEPAPGDGGRDARRRWIFEALEQRFGKPEVAAKRIALANDILNQLELAPMGRVQRSVVTGVYGVLLAVPLALVLFTALGATGFDFGGTAADPDVAKLHEKLELEYQRLVAESERLDIDALIDDLPGDMPRNASATAVSLEALQQQIGSLPPDLESLYRSHDGRLDDLAIGPAAEVRRIDPDVFVDGDLQYAIENGELWFWHEELGGIAIPRSRVAGWWQLGHNTTTTSYAFLDPAAPPGELSLFLFGEYGQVAYRSVTELLRERWVSERHAAAAEAVNARIDVIRERQLRGKSVPELMDAFPRPSVFVRALTGEFWGAGAASSEDMAALTARVGRPLPDGLVEAWSTADGHAQSGLLPIAKVAPASTARQANVDRAIGIAAAAGLDEFSLANCWVVGGREFADVDGTPSLYGATFWCPDAPREHRFIDLVSSDTADTYETVLRRGAMLMAL